MFNFCNKKYFTGSSDPIRILLRKSKDLLPNFYTNDPLSIAASTLLINPIRTVFSSTVQSKNRSIEIFEVGAGMGGTTKFVLDMLVDAGIPFPYVFADISTSFFASAKTRYMKYPDVATCWI